MALFVGPVGGVFYNSGGIRSLSSESIVAIERPSEIRIKKMPTQDAI
jgi:hypothetical protein